MFCESTVIKRANITQRDISKGKAGRCSECPGALAINRLLAKGWRTFVYGDSVVIEEIEPSSVSQLEFAVRKRLSVPTPSELKTFVIGFDNIYQAPLHLKPVSFDIEIPAEAARKGVFK